MSFFSHIPIWLVFLGTIAFILICIEGCFRLGRHHKSQLVKSNKPEGSGSIGTMVQIQLGLVAFLVAFTFGFTAARLSERRLLIIDEANAIGTTFLRADFLPRAKADGVKELLREYVALRLRLTQDLRQTHDDQFVVDAITESNKLQDQLWSYVKEAAALHDSPCVAQFVSTVNDTIDLQSKRLSAERYGKLPDVIWLALYVLTILGMSGVGYQFGHGGSRNWITASLVAVSFSIVLTLIADIDRQHDGFVLLSQQPLVDLAKQIGPPSSETRSRQ